MLKEYDFFDGGKLSSMTIKVCVNLLMLLFVNSITKNH